MSYTQKDFRRALTNLAKKKKEAKTKNDPALWTEKDEKEYKAFKAHYKYYYEGGDFPTINAPWINLEVFPNKPTNDWVGCKNCDWERMLHDNEDEKSPPWCPNVRGGDSSRTPDEHYKAEGTHCYPSNKRKTRGSSWLDTLETIVGEEVNEEERKKQEQEKQALEQQIVAFQQALKAFKQIPKNHPSYNEYQKQQIEKQLNEAIEKYKVKFRELPSSLRDNNSNDDNRERERANPAITNSDCGVRSHS